MDEPISVVPADTAPWEELREVFGARGEAAKCFCQRMRLPHRQWHDMPRPDRADRLRAQAAAGEGLLARIGDTPAGWCAVAPRRAFLRLFQTQTVVPWAGRAEDRADPTVWVAACFVTRVGYRRRGVSRALARAAVDFARSHGARALEAYPMIPQPGQDVPWGELSVGHYHIFADAGLAEISRPVLRRAVMRIDFAKPG